MHELTGLLREYDRARGYTDQLWRDLTPDEVTWRPHENSSAIGWRHRRWPRQGPLRLTRGMTLGLISLP